MPPDKMEGRLSCGQSVADMVEWRPVVGAETHVEVSSDGRVRSIDRVVVDTLGRVRFRPGVALKQVRLQTGYPAINIGRRMVRIHTLVAAAFLGPRPSEAPYVLHGNGIKADNRVQNLRYGTAKENMADSIRHGVIKHGEARHGTKLTRRAAETVLALERKASTTRLSHAFKVSATTIRHIQRGRCWTDAKACSVTTAWERLRLAEQAPLAAALSFLLVASWFAAENARLAALLHPPSPTGP
jgi:hypothetical protein